MWNKVENLRVEREPFPLRQKKDLKKRRTNSLHCSPGFCGQQHLSFSWMFLPEYRHQFFKTLSKNINQPIFWKINFLYFTHFSVAGSDQSYLYFVFEKIITYTLVHKDLYCCKFKGKKKIIPYSQKHYFDSFFFFNIWQPMLTYVIMYGLIVCRINIYCISIFMLCTTGILRYMNSTTE